MQSWPFMHNQLPWILASLSLALMAGAALLWLMQSRRHRTGPLPTEWTLTARPVFTADERRVYRLLREALPHHIVLSKLPLVRFCQPTDPQEVRYWYKLLGTTHVAFAICSSNGRVLAAIDMDTGRKATSRVQQIKQSVLAACRVRYLRCAPDELPTIAELQLLVPYSGAAASGAQAAPTSRPNTPRGAVNGSRRRERATLWQDSSSLQDSFFGTEGGSGEPISGFGSQRPGLRVREVPLPAEELGGVVVDTPLSALRH